MKTARDGRTGHTGTAQALTAIAAGMVAVIFGLTACSATPSTSSSTPTSSAGPDSSQLPDPLEVLTDKRADFYIGENPSVALHASGSGATSFDIALPGPPVTDLKFFVTCTPESAFTVTFGTKLYSGNCVSAPQTFGSFPLPPDTKATSVTLDVADGVHFWIIAVPLSENIETGE